MSRRPQLLSVVVSVFCCIFSAPIPVWAGEAEAYQHLNERMDAYFSAQQPRLIESSFTPYPPGPDGTVQGIAFIYDAALASTMYVARGTADDLRRAKLICDALQLYQGFDAQPDGRLRQAYRADQNLQTFGSADHPYVPTGFNVSNTGEIAWVGLAWLTYFDKVRDRTIADPFADPNASYLRAAVRAAEFLANQTRDTAQSGFYLGFRERTVDMTVGVPIASYGTVTTAPSTILIPLSAFAAQGINIQRLRALSLVFNDSASQTGRITFQSIRFINTVTGASLVVDNYADANRFLNTLGFGVGSIDYGNIFSSDPTGKTIAWNSADGTVDWWYSLLVADPAQLRRLDALDYTHLELRLSGAAGNERFTVELQGYPSAQDLDQAKSAEHNIDAYAFFMRLYDVTGNATWKTYADQAKQYVETVAWDSQEGKFWVGSLAGGALNTGNLVEDVQSWAVLALGRVTRYGRALTWADDHLRIDSTNPLSNGFTGFDFGFLNGSVGDVAPDGVWFEGTAHMAAAYQVSGRSGGADSSAYFLGQLDLAQQNAMHANGKGLVAASHDNVTTGFGWGYYPSLHIGTTAWYIAAKRHLNPFWATSTDQPVPHDNVAPALAPIGNRTGVEGQPMTFTVTATDADGDTPLTYTASSLPLGATFNATTRTFTWTPDFDQGTATPYDVSFTATDPYGLADSQTISITVADQPLRIVAQSTFPNAISPNGDNVQDTTQISAMFNHYVGHGKVLIRSSSGANARTMVTTAGGSITQAWDGKSDAGLIVPDGTYTYVVRGVDIGNSLAEGIGTILVDTVPPTVTGPTDAPDPFKPSQGQTNTISFTLSEQANVSLVIYLNGNTQIRALIYNALRPAGPQQFVWDGKKNNGSLAAPGTYDYKLWVTDPAGNKASAPYPRQGTITLQ